MRSIRGGLVGALIMLGAQPAALAAELRSGHAVLIPAGTTIADDLYVAGGQVDVDGHVTGDLVAAGGTVTVRGRVDGDVVVAGGTVRLEGATGHSIRAAGGDVEVAGPVGKDVLAFAGSLKTRPGLRVGGQSIVGGGDVQLAGHLGTSLQANAGTLQVDGEVAGPATLAAPTLAIARGARIAGDLRMATGSVAPVADGARVGGEVITNPLDRRAAGDRADSGFGGWLVGFLMALTAGLALLWLLPAAADESSRTAMRQPGWRLAAGLLALVGAPVVAALMMVTVVGIPLGVLLLAAYAATVYLAQLVVAWSAGRALYGYRNLPLERYGSRAAALALGLLLVYLARAIPVLGPIVTFLVVLWGLGAIGTMAYEWYHGRRGARMAA